MARVCHVFPRAGVIVVEDGEVTHFLPKGKQSSARKGLRQTGALIWLAGIGVVMDSDRNIFVRGGPFADSFLLIQIGLN